MASLLSTSSFNPSEGRHEHAPSWGSRTRLLVSFPQLPYLTFNKSLSLSAKCEWGWDRWFIRLLKVNNELKYEALFVTIMNLFFSVLSGWEGEEGTNRLRRNKKFTTRIICTLTKPWKMEEAVKIFSICRGTRQSVTIKLWIQQFHAVC